MLIVVREKIEMRVSRARKEHAGKGQRRAVLASVGRIRPDRKMTRSFLTLGVCAVIAAAGMTTLGVISASAPASAFPGSPGIPSDATVVTLENFENGTAATSVRLNAYTGIAGATYTADPYWLDSANCNGVIVRYDSPVWGVNDCSNLDSVASRQNVRRLADVLGQVAAGVVGGSTPTTPVNGSTAATRSNHAVAEWTTSYPGPNNSVEFRTQTGLNVPATGPRFYSVSVDVAETSCGYLGGVNNSKLEFYLMLGGSMVPTKLNASPIRACTDSRAKYFTSPNLPVLPSGVGAGTVWGNGGPSVAAGRYYSDQALMLTPAQVSNLQIIMRNQTGASEGNDNAFDNIRLIDATPQLDKSFSPTTITQGQSTTLTYTVTNTTDLGAKNDWHFVDSLPAGLTASGPLGGTCVRTASSVTAGTVDVTGNLAAGSALCTITVTVTSNTPGNYNNSGCVANNGTAIPNCTNNFPTITGINPPGTAPLTVLPVVDLSITKSANLAQYTPGSPITYTVTAHNNGPSDAINAVLTDPLPASITGATWTCTVTVLGTANLPPTTGPTKCGATSGTGSITDTVRINTGGTITYTVTGTVAAGTTGNLVNKATIVPAATTTIPNMPGGGPNPVPGSTTTVPTVDAACPPSPGIGCSATVTTPPAPGVWNVAKTATVNGVTPTTNIVKGGDVITYTVKATGVSGLTSNAVLTDNLSNVLDDATFVSGSAALAVGGAAPVAVANPVAPGNILTTGKFNLTPGVVATLTYQVTVKANVWNQQLINVVTGSGDTPPSSCAVGVTPAAPICTTTHVTPAKVLIQKIGESGSATWVPMDGSTWAVFNDNAGQQGTPYTGAGITAVVPASTGQFQLSNIPTGTYWLSETTAPAGFSLLAEPVQFTIAANGAVSIGQGAGGGVVTAADIDGDQIFQITVRDVPALQLPESGGPGTIAFTAGGSVLILAALLILVSSLLRRRRAEQTKRTGSF